MGMTSWRKFVGYHRSPSEEVFGLPQFLNGSWFDVLWEVRPMRKIITPMTARENMRKTLSSVREGTCMAYNNLREEW